MGSVQEGYTLVQYDQQVREILGRTAAVYCYDRELSKDDGNGKDDARKQ